MFQSSKKIMAWKMLKMYAVGLTCRLLKVTSFKLKIE